MATRSYHGGRGRARPEQEIHRADPGQETIRDIVFELEDQLIRIRHAADILHRMSEAPSLSSNECLALLAKLIEDDAGSIDDALTRVSRAITGAQQ